MTKWPFSLYIRNYKLINKKLKVQNLHGTKKGTYFVDIPQTHLIA